MLVALLIGSLGNVACVGQVEVDPSVGPCQEPDLDDLPESTLESEVSGDVAVVWRSSVLRDNSDDVFAPEIDGEGTILSVREVWEEGADEAPFCMEPTVTITGLEGALTVRWYTDQSSVPFDSVVVEPE